MRYNAARMIVLCEAPTYVHWPVREPLFRSADAGVRH